MSAHEPRFCEGRLINRSAQATFSKLAVALFFVGLAAAQQQQVVGPATGPAYLVPNDGFVAVGTSQYSDLPYPEPSSGGLVIVHDNNPELDFFARANAPNTQQWQLTVNQSGGFEINSFIQDWQVVQTLLYISNPMGTSGGGVDTTLPFSAASVNTATGFNWDNPNAPADSQRWWFTSEADGNLRLRVASDNESTSNVVMEFDRKGFQPGALKIPALKASSGKRYLCIDTAGNVTSSATVCSGT
ncbi:MAG: hypothetical protein JOY62_03655 [Acidobacteriaceae bacterium]|nr:hypothetical protein [Acidobacteriaceae bacterium]MBV9779047.1 hypothetical protein [Acidobacteriaceae bacterium]